LVDTSAGDDFKARQDAASHVVGTLGAVDFVGVVGFGDSASTYNSKMKRAIGDIKGDASDYVAGLKAAGKANYEAGFKSAYSLLSGVASDSYGKVGCENIIVLITSASIGAGKSSADLGTYINGLDSSVDATILSFSIKGGSGKANSKSVSDAHKGTNTEIDGGKDVAE